MKWIHIMDRQPEDGQSIIQIDRPYEGHYTMGMRKYCGGGTFAEFLEFGRVYGLRDPDFWWIAAEDFPFPDKETK